MGSRQPEEKSPSQTPMLLVASVSVTPVLLTEASSRVCPDGQVISAGGGETVSEAVTFPLSPELNVPDADTGR